MATPTTTRLHAPHDEAGQSGRAFEAAAGTGRGAGIGATLGTLLGAGAGLMAGIGALPVPGAGPVVAAGWLVAVLTGAGVGAAVGGLLRSLTGAGGDKGDAHVHAEAVRRGGTALPARVEEAEAAHLEAVPAGGGDVDAARRPTEHRAEGWSRPGPVAPDRTALGVQRERERRVRVHGAHVAPAAVRGSAEAVRQAGSPDGDAPRQGAEVTADAARQGGEAGTEAVRRVRVHGGRAAAGAALRRDAEALQRGGRPAGDAPRQSTDVAADATRRGGEAEAEAEPACREAQAVADSRRRIARDVAEPVEAASREVAEAARDTTEEARRPAAPAAAESGPRGLQQGAAGLFEGVVRTNLRVAQELFRLSDPVPMVELQQRFAREYTDTLVRSGATLAGAVRRTADETLRPLEQQIERQQREQANQNQRPSGVQTAAE